MAVTTETTHVLTCDRCGAESRRVGNEKPEFPGAFEGDHAQLRLTRLHANGAGMPGRDLDLCVACTAELVALLEAAGPLE